MLFYQHGLMNKCRFLWSLGKMLPTALGTTHSCQPTARISRRLITPWCSMTPGPEMPNDLGRSVWNSEIKLVKQ